MSRDYRRYLVVFFGSTLFACSAQEGEGWESEAQGSTQQELFGVRSTVLRDAAGAFVGRVVFAPTGAVTTVSVSARLNPPQNGIHGFHVHANDNPANGDGCVADPAQPARR